MILALFFFQVVAVGAIVNTQFMVIGTRMDPTLISVGLEISFCVGSIIASTSPGLASMSPPTPLIAYLVYCIVGISVVSTFAEDQYKIIDVE